MWKITTIVALAAALLLTALPGTAQDDGSDLINNLYGYRFCPRDPDAVAPYALCEASICTPTGRQIMVNVAGDGQSPFPEAACTCPILTGRVLADVFGGNMHGNCDPPGPGQVWSLYSPQPNLPQQINNWSLENTAVSTQLCPASDKVGTTFANCFSFACTVDQKPTNGVSTATCYCPMGEGLDGSQIAEDTAVITPAGQCNEDVCFQHPVGAANTNIRSDKHKCYGFPGGEQPQLKLEQNYSPWRDQLIKLATVDCESKDSEQAKPVTASHQ
jgi:hypothetical protein